MRGAEFLDGNDFSPKAQDFLRELRELCTKHQVTLATSGYDGLQIYDMERHDEYFCSAGVDDCTDKRAP